MSVLHLDENNFNEVLSSNDVVLVDFWADWCMPCKMFAPVLEKFESEFGDRATIGKLNIDEAPSIAEKYQVASIPTVVVFKNGEEVRRSVGAVSKGELAKLIEA